MQLPHTSAILFLCLGLLGNASSGGQETFENTGLAGSWVAAGEFTGQDGVVWTYANARGTPTVYSGNPSITLRGGSAANKGWLQSSTLTGGVGRISVIFKQDLSAHADFNFLVNDILVGNYRSTGVPGEITEVSFEVVPPTNQPPFTNEFVLVVSNRLSSGGAAGLDDLTWEPFRLFVRLNRSGTLNVFAEHECDVVAEVFSIAQDILGGWEVPPEFGGTTSDTNDWQLTLTPAPADIGQTFEFKYLATEEQHPGTVAQASFQITVEEAPSFRTVDFENANFTYNTNAGVVTNLNGMDWMFLNVRTSDSTDRKIGTRSARFRHSSTALPASMESMETFEGIGTISLHYAYYGDSDRVVLFEAQIRAEEDEQWATLENGSFNVAGHNDITNSMFSVDVQRADPIYFRLITTGQFGQIANIDDLRIRKFGDTLPYLAWTGPTHLAIGRASTVDVELVNAQFIMRTWDYTLTPSNSHADFEITGDDQLRFRWAPQSTNEWGDYTLTATARTDTQTYSTTLTLCVVSPPEFQLAPVATELDVGDVVDVWVTNVVLHANATNWTTAWQVVPTFVQPHSVSNKSRFRIATGTQAADRGSHQVHAIVTDLATGVQTTQSVVITVGTVPTEENYAIYEFEPNSYLVISGKMGRVFVPFGVADLTRSPAETNWLWGGAPVTNVDGCDVHLDLPTPSEEHPAPPMFFYGVQVKPTP